MNINKRMPVINQLTMDKNLFLQSSYRKKINRLMTRDNRGIVVRIINDDVRK